MGRLTEQATLKSLILSEVRKFDFFVMQGNPRLLGNPSHIRPRSHKKIPRQSPLCYCVRPSLHGARCGVCTLWTPATLQICARRVVGTLILAMLVTLLPILKKYMAACSILIPNLDTHFRTISINVLVSYLHNGRRALTPQCFRDALF